MPTAFRDRTEAGRLLADQLTGYASRPNVLVLALPRGGVPVASEVARALGAPLDVFVVRKLGVPGHEELALGAIASGGVCVLNDDVVQALRLPRQVIAAVAARELRELERRERAHCGDRPAPEVRGRTVILVDDGLATGSTMRAAVAAADSRPVLRGLEPERQARQGAAEGRIPGAHRGGPQGESGPRPGGHRLGRLQDPQEARVGGRDRGRQAGPPRGDPRLWPGSEDRHGS